MSRLAHCRIAAVMTGLMVVCSALAAAQRPVKTKIHNYANAPVMTKESKVALVETFASPMQAGLQDSTTRLSRIRYANRAGLTPSTFELQGELLCHNKGSQRVEAMAVTIVVLDAFHQPIRSGARGEPMTVQQMVIQLPQRGAKRVVWQLPVSNGDVYEVAAIVTRVRFEDGSVWMAPNEELVDAF